MEAPGGTTPVFCKTRDMDSYSVQTIDMCEAMADVIGAERVLGAQRIHGLWRL